MKKTICLFALILLYIPSYGQQITQYKTKLDRMIKPAIISNTNDGMPIFIQKWPNLNTIVIYSTTENGIEKKKISLNKNRFENFYNKGAILYSVCTFDDKENICGITLGRANTGEKEPQFNFKNIAQFSGEQTITKSCMSKNSNLLGFYTVILTDKKTIKGTHLMVTDFDGNMIWENSIVTDFKGGGYYVDDIAVSDEGELTVVLNSKTINKENEVSNQEIILVIANENDIHQEVIDFSDYNITSAKTLLKSDGNYFVAAYGREINDGNFNGCFFTTFDTELNELNVIEEKPFDDVIDKEEDIRWKYRPKLLYLMERPDGSVTALGELQYSERSSSVDGSFYILYTDEILVNHFETNGDYDFNSIKKSQVSSVLYYKDEFNDYSVSYKAWQNKEGTIFLAYNNHPDNTFGSNNKLKQCTKMKKENGAITLVSIDQDNQISGGNIISDKRLYMANFLGFNNGNIYCTLGINKGKLARIVIDMNDDSEINRIHYSSNTSEGSYDQEEDEEDEEN